MRPFGKRKPVKKSKYHYMLVLDEPSERWSMDLQHDLSAVGLRFLALYTSNKSSDG